jgi:urease subunit gamma
VALICDEMLEEVRAGRSYDEVLEHGRRVLGRDDVMDGVPEMIPTVQVEAMFVDGTKLLTLHQPIGDT